MSEIIVTEVVP